MKIPIITKLLEKRSNLSTPERWVIDWFTGGTQSKSGINVNEQTALYSSAVFASVRIISETIASLPLNVYKRLENNGKEKARDHPLFRLLHDQPNEEMTAFTFWETIVSHIMLWGNGYVYIEYNNSGRPVALWPLTPNKIKPKRNEKTKRIEYELNLPDGGTKILYFEQIIHVPGLGFDGLVGYSPIQMAKEAIGLSLAAEEFGSRFFANGMNVGAVVTHPNTLSDPAYKRLKRELQEKYEGLGKSHTLMLLEEGMQFAKNTIPPNDAQFLETRKFQLNEIARIFRVPPHMIGDLERATFSNIEHQSIEFVVHTIRPWLVRIEQALKMKLFNSDKFFPEFKVDGLLRGDIKSRFEAYQIASQNGWFNADEIRELENMNPQPNGQGKVYFINSASLPKTQLINQASNKGGDGKNE
ncbi:phage portal protein [Tepidibacillus decaturensis]|uniref:Portal protein n=1 Tax=Tepidibacillus decaturensis TaxID=1413211 RepID=A0A135L1N8_9BACI|nr:phage portal protein [Tepidibacillus decaturensis]KXG42870.1 hypothetical protein U473_01615 [Tepidibacillus decaturensis]